MKKILFLSAALFILCSTIIYSQPLSVAITGVTNASCNGINNGSITAMESNGTGPYTYSWSPSGGTGATATNLAPGSYTITVTDAAFATATATATVLEDSPVIVTTDAMSNYFGYNVSCAGGNNGWINTTSSGGLMAGFDSVEFNYTGAQQIFVVPAGITQVTLKAWGAQGGANWVNNTNYGGYAQGDLAVTPGETLYVYVGEQPITIAGGFNGGGNGEGAGKGGGGASDVRQGGTTLNDRKIVGAGAGAGGYWSSLHVVGGIGGGLTGGNGYRDPNYASNPGGEGATQTSSGTGTCVSLYNPAMTGGFGYGGSPAGCGCEGYGGGGGWWGGAGSGNCRGGGGGSSYIALLTNASTVGGVRTGHGKVTIIYGAPETISYLWSNGATTDDVTNLTAGNYTLTATSFSGCITTETFVLTEPSLINANLSSTNISCNGANDGIVTSIPAGGIPGYTYLWPYNSATTSSISGLSIGTYVVNITDTAGCSYSDSVMITEPSPLNLVFNSTDALCFGGNEGSIIATPSGGTSPYSYLWSPNSETTASITGLSSGVYILALTDTNGCNYTDTVTISQPSDLLLSATTIDETTGNNGSIDLTVSGGVPGYTFSWSNSATTEDIGGLAGGSYTVIVTDTNGCDDTLTVIVSSTFGIAESGMNELNIYPNPSEGIFYIQPDAKITGEFSLSIMDMHGKTVYSLLSTINNPITIDATTLAAGTYMVHLNTEMGTFTKRIVIK